MFFLCYPCQWLWNGFVDDAYLQKHFRIVIPQDLCVFESKYFLKKEISKILIFTKQTVILSSVLVRYFDKTLLSSTGSRYPWVGQKNNKLLIKTFSHKSKYSLASFRPGWSQYRGSSKVKVTNHDKDKQICFRTLQTRRFIFHRTLHTLQLTNLS